MKVIGRYQLTEQLGQGGMGVVYRAFDTLLERVVAVKVISGALEAGPEHRERFFREARAAGQLSHRNIITIHDLGEHDGQPYLAMEYLEGEDLQRRLARSEPVSLSRKLDLALDVCDALEYAHARGIVHRDIKPANIFITRGGTAKILDFGLARLVTSELTNSNMMMGTVNYMAPEQVSGERADHRSDIFSVGVLLYEVFGGRKAFEADSFAATLYKILQEAPEPLTTIDPTLPEPIAAVVERAMVKSRDERYQEMGEMVRDLAQCRQLVPRDPSTLGRPGSGSQARPSDAPRLRPPSHAFEDAPTMPPGTPTPAPAMVSAAGKTPAHPVPSAAGAPAARASRLRIWVVAAAVIVMAGAVFWGTRPSPAVPTPASDEQAGTPAPRVDDSAVATALDEAAAALEAGDFETARRRADVALSLDPAHAEAQRLHKEASTSLELVARGLGEARAHFDAGRYDEASRAAGDVLGLVPGHADARRLMQEAASRARGRGAEEARARMSRAKAAARGAGAPSRATAAYEAALGAERHAERLLGSGDVADATARFYEASGLFRSAEIAAQNAAVARAEPPRREGPARRDEPPRRDEHAAHSPPVPPAALPQPAAPAPVVPAPGGRPPGDQPPVPAPSAAPPVALPPSKPQPTPAPHVEPPAEELIERLLASYEAALEARSLPALKQIWPGLGGGQESAIRNEFTHASRIDVEIASPQIEVSGTTATARFLRRYELVTTDGQRLSSRSLTTMSLRQTAAGWVITNLRFEPVR